MGVFTFSEESISAVAPATLYKALVFDGDNLIPKVVDAIQSVEILEGTGAAGTTKKINYLEDGHLHYAKHKVDAVDKDNFVYNYTLVESDTFPETLEKIAVETKLAAAPNGGSVVKVTVNYVTKGDAKPSEEELKIGKQKGDGLFKAVEGGKTHHVLHKVEAVDEASFVYNYSIVEASDLPETVEKISVETKLVEGPNGGAVAKISVKYFTKGDAQPSEEELKTGKAKGDALFKAIEAYLLAHPEYS
ncbi:class-10 pathogenesis-related protein 1-like [Neltuma alba]|uniref:class-10 pathogenesis-related protein 1-like n=1 Tax=Neltuma alba TaxID=207710 RepID=UPI0010A3DF76|nr:class-10 pathogenesis-related protein 1-like [Prosopis alba]XP_028795903.1 class-10 pathogenesis-related protein 1-like [Prosopis alba]